jgi:hypothetical protein
VRVVARSGLRVLLDRKSPLGGSTTAGGSLTAHVAVPRGGEGQVALGDFFDGRGFSLVAGRAALVPAGSDPRGAAEAAARAGAVAVLLYGTEIPPGALGLDEDVSVPVLSVPEQTARELRSAIGSTAGATVTIGAATAMPNSGTQHVAAFSSTGLTFDGTVKPDLVGPGVGVPTASPGANPDGSPRFATVNGSSAAAATVAGAAALLAEARPSLDAGALKSLLVGAAQPLAGDAVSAQGAGLVDIGAAASAEVAASPATLSLGRAGGAGWRATQTITVRNVSSRTLRLGLTAEHLSEGAAAVDLAADPASLRLARGETAEVKVTARVRSVPVGTVPADGALRIAVSGGATIRVPWLVAFGARPPLLLARVKLSLRAFKPSDSAPALLTFQAGRLAGRQIVPVARLDVRLFSPDRGSLGLLARLRDLLPGSYAFGLTGRSPTGEQLAPGSYTLRVIAVPTDGTAETVRSVRFTIK